MYTTVPMEAGFFLASIGSGVFVTFLYDLLRIFRRLAKPKTLAVNLQDVLFLIASALIIFHVAYTKNSGEIRWHGFIGCGIGVCLYMVVVKNRFLNAGTFLVKWIIIIIEKTLKILLFPLKLVLRILKKPVGFVMWYTCRGMRRVKHISRRGSDKLRVRLKNTAFMLRKK